MPPKVGAMRMTVSMNSWRSLGIHLDIEHIDTGKVLEQHTLASITGFASAPTLPSPRTALPSVITATRLPLAVYLYASSGSAAMHRTGSATPGV